MSEIITFEQYGNFKKLTNYLEKIRNYISKGILDKYGKRGVELLSSATPIDTGLTSSSWYYEIQNDDNVAALLFCNSNFGDGHCPIAIILQYGHGTGTGGWVEGIDYINPVIRPLFNELAKEAWKEVTRV